ncbi:hypothetical protein BGZ83_001738 [Gryganskiella cystojenkinii]|nr:hypothetical protein BGZ83_001738 [Gryganskiella cystojenkinii]
MPAENTSTTKAPPKKTSAGATPPTMSKAPATRTTTGRGTATLTSSVPTLSSSPTPSPTASSGLSGGAIGGIAGGAVVLFALVGLVFYKRRKRAVGSSQGKGNGGTDDKNEPIYMNASNYSKKKRRSENNNGISAPLALTADRDIAPSPFGPPQQQQQSLQNRDDHYGPPPGAGPYGGRPSQGDRIRYGDEDPRSQYRGGPPGPGSVINDNDYYPVEGQRHQRNNSQRGPGNIDTHKASNQQQGGEYYDVSLDQEYFNGSISPSSRKSPVQPRGVSHGNMTPAPEYYLGKEDIDPRRDIRGMDSPENYIRDQKVPVQDQSRQQQQQHQGPPILPPIGLGTPRSSLSSDGGSEYLTLEQAQKAHNQKMMGHKESIGSVEHLINHAMEERHRQSPLQKLPEQQQQQSTQQKQQQRQERSEPLQSPTTPSFAPDSASITMSESTMSMMPSLPPSASPQSIGPQRGHTRQGSDPRLHNKVSSGNIRAGQKGPNSGPLSPLGAPDGHDDPYAESAFSGDFGDDRSMISGHPPSPYGPVPSSHGMHSPHSQHKGGSRPYSPYPPQHHGGPPGSPYGGYPQGNGGGSRQGPPGGGGYSGPGPYNNGYNGRPQGPPMRGGPSPGPGYGRHGPPGPGYGGPPPGHGGYRGPPNNNYPPQGYPGRVASPGPGGYRGHPQQQQMRDPGYQQAY